MLREKSITWSVYKAYIQFFKIFSILVHLLVQKYGSEITANLMEYWFQSQQEQTYHTVHYELSLVLIWFSSGNILINYAFQSSYWRWT